MAAKRLWTLRCSLAMGLVLLLYRGVAAWPWFGSPAHPRSGDSAVFDLGQRRREHWAWQPVRSAQPPNGIRNHWAADPIDLFILAKLDERGLTPAEPADRPVLIRRLYFDLIGLPPTRAEVESFVADGSEGAYERVVDRLLASPHFGERWGRHWLDLVRYAETRGHEFDHLIPNAFQYRDYVIRALNADVPYNQFVTEHIAGDLMEPRLHAEGFNESILGTGFWFLGEEVHSPVDIRGDETDRIDNRIDVYSKTFLGMTVSCARCHDHKFDAISMRDYYGLAGYVLSSSYRQVPFRVMERHRALAEQTAAIEERFRPQVVHAISQALKPGVAEFAKYLFAARTVLQQDPANDSLNRNKAVADIAAQEQLDSKRLARWVDELKQAQTSEHHPLHAWSALAHAEPPTASGDFVVRSLLNRLASSNAAAQTEQRQILNLAAPQNREFWQDGVAFRVRRPGDVRFTTDAAEPIAEVYQFAAAVSEQAHKLEPDPGTEREPGKVSWPQAGQTLRTRTFDISKGKLYYLVRGAGHAYAAVDSHRLIAGPLHGSLVISWDAGPNNEQPRWIEHDLTTYVGHRAHIEFSPREQGNQQAGPVARPELCVLAVVEAERVPANSDEPRAMFHRRLIELGAESAAQLAQSYQAIFADTIHRFGSDQIMGSDRAPSDAWLASWLIEHDELLVGDAEAAARQIAEAARPLSEQLAAIQRQFIRVSETAPALMEGGGVDEYLLSRGNHRSPGAIVPRRFLEAIDPQHNQPAGENRSGRLELAAKMTEPTNPLVPRVIVNRIWHHLFGRGIVPSVDNLGVLGETPTHPELLDHLAHRFMEDGWSTKRLIRAIVLSSTYRMSSRVPSGAEATDPENMLLHHKPVRRLEGEVIRDSILAISRRLDRKMYGTSVELYLTPFMEGRGRPSVSGPMDGAGRRSIYMRVRRNFPHPMFSAFDSPTPFSTVGRRSVSNVPAQALALMNNELVVTEAARWANQVIAQSAEPAERIEQMFLEAYGRRCTAQEMDEVLQFIADQTARYAGSNSAERRPWEDLAHLLFNAKEFIFIQ